MPERAHALAAISNLSYWYAEFWRREGQQGRALCAQLRRTRLADPGDIAL
jgi:hypothetical protein